MNNPPFGQAGWLAEAADDQDAFLGFGKKARRRRQARRERKNQRKTIRIERRQLKNDNRRADIDAKRTQTGIVRAMMLGTPAPVARTSTSSPTPRVPITVPIRRTPPVSPSAAATIKKADVPLTQQAGFGGNTLFLAVGALIIGGYLLLRRRAEAPVLTSAELDA